MTAAERQRRRREKVRAQQPPKPPRAEASQEEQQRLQFRCQWLEAELATCRRELAALRQRLAAAEIKITKPPKTPSEELAAVQRQLQAARTRIRNLTAEKHSAWSAAHANPAAISKRDLNRLRMVVHPDRRASLTEQEMTEAAKIINRLQIHVIDA